MQLEKQVSLHLRSSFYVVKDTKFVNAAANFSANLFIPRLHILFLVTSY